MTAETITFERDGREHSATVEAPAVPIPDALIVECDGTRYAILVSFGSGEFVARPVLSEPDEYPLRRPR